MKHQAKATLLILVICLVAGTAAAEFMAADDSAVAATGCNSHLACKACGNAQCVWCFPKITISAGMTNTLNYGQCVDDGAKCKALEFGNTSKVPLKAAESFVKGSKPTIEVLAKTATAMCPSDTLITPAEATAHPDYKGCFKAGNAWCTYTFTFVKAVTKGGMCMPKTTTACKLELLNLTKAPFPGASVEAKLDKTGDSGAVSTFGAISAVALAVVGLHIVF